MAVEAMNIMENHSNYAARIGTAMHLTVAGSRKNLKELLAKTEGDEIARQYAQTIEYQMGDEGARHALLDLPADDRGGTLRPLFQRHGLKSHAERKFAIPGTGMQGDVDLLVTGQRSGAGEFTLATFDIKPLGQGVPALYFSPGDIDRFAQMLDRWRGERTPQKEIQEDVQGWLEGMGDDLFLGKPPANLNYEKLAGKVMRFGMQTLLAYPAGIAGKYGQLPPAVILGYNNRELIRQEQQGTPSAQSKEAQAQMQRVRAQVGLGVERALQQNRAAPWGPMISTTQEILQKAAAAQQQVLQAAVEEPDFRRNQLGRLQELYSLVRRTGANITSGDFFPERIRQMREPLYGTEEEFARTVDWHSQRFAARPESEPVEGLQPVLPGQSYGSQYLGRDMEMLVGAMARRQGEAGWRLKKGTFDWRPAGDADRTGDVERQQYAVRFELENTLRRDVRKFSDVFNVYPELGGAMSTRSHQFVVPDVRDFYGHREAMADYMAARAVGQEDMSRFHTEYLVPTGGARRLGRHPRSVVHPQDATGQGTKQSMLDIVSTVTLRGMRTDSVRQIQDALKTFSETSQSTGQYRHPVDIVTSGSRLTGGDEGNPPTGILVSRFNQLQLLGRAGIEARFEGTRLGIRRDENIHATRYGFWDAVQNTLFRRARTQAEAEAGASPFHGKIAPGRSARLDEGMLQNVTVATSPFLPGAAEPGMGGAGIADWMATAVSPTWLKQERTELAPMDMEAHLEARNIRRALDADRMHVLGRGLSTRGVKAYTGRPVNWEQVRDDSPLRDEFFDVSYQFPGAMAVRMADSAWIAPLGRTAQQGVLDAVAQYAGAEFVTQEKMERGTRDVTGRLGGDLGLAGGKAYARRAGDPQAWRKAQAIVEDVKRAFAEPDMPMTEKVKIWERWEEAETAALWAARKDVEEHGSQATHAWRGFRHDPVRLSFAHPYIQDKATLQSTFELAGGGLGGMKFTSEDSRIKATGSRHRMDWRNLQGGERLADVGLFAFGREGVKQGDKAVASHFASSKFGYAHLQQVGLEGVNLEAIKLLDPKTTDPDLQGVRRVDLQGHRDALSTLNRVSEYLMGLDDRKRRNLLQASGTLLTVPHVQDVVPREYAEVWWQPGLKAVGPWSDPVADDLGPGAGKVWYGQEGETLLRFAEADEPHMVKMDALNVEVMLGKADLRARFAAPPTSRESSFPVEETIRQTVPQAQELARRWDMPLVDRMATATAGVVARRSRGARRDFASMFEFMKSPDTLRDEGVKTLRLGSAELSRIHDTARELTQQHHYEGRLPTNAPDLYLREAYHQFFKGREGDVIVVGDGNSEVALPSWSAIHRSSHTEGFGREGTTLGAMFHKLAQDASTGSVMQAARQVRHQAERLLHHDKQVSNVFHGTRIAGRHALQGTAKLPMGAHLDIQSPEDVQAAIDRLGWKLADVRKLGQYSDTSMYLNGLSVQYLLQGDNDGDTLHALTFEMEGRRLAASTRYPQSSGGQTLTTLGLADYFTLSEDEQVQLSRYNMAMILSNSMGAPFSQRFLERTEGTVDMRAMQGSLTQARRELLSPSTGILAWVGATLGQGAQRQGREYWDSLRESSTASSLYAAWNQKREAARTWFTPGQLATKAADQVMGKRAIQYIYDVGSFWPRSARELDQFFAGRQRPQDIRQLKGDYLHSQNILSTLYQTYLDESAGVSTTRDLWTHINEAQPGQKFMAQKAALGFTSLDEPRELTKRMVETATSMPNLPRDPTALSFMLLQPDSDLHQFAEAREKLKTTFLDELEDTRKWPRDAQGRSNLFRTDAGRQRLRKMFTDLGQGMYGGKFEFDPENEVFQREAKDMLGSFLMANLGAQRLQKGIERLSDTKFEEQYKMPKEWALEMMDSITTKPDRDTEVVHRGARSGRMMDWLARIMGGRGTTLPLRGEAMGRGPEALGAFYRMTGSDNPERHRRASGLTGLLSRWARDPNREWMN